MFFTVHRAGSMFIYGIARELSLLGGYRYRSVNARNLKVDNPNAWKKRGYCYAPLRGLFTSLDLSTLDDYNILLHLRDPRDVITSSYFAATFYHGKTIGKNFLHHFYPTREQRERWKREGIDVYALQRAVDNPFSPESVLTRYKEYCEILLGKPNVTFVKYEEMVSDFEAWLTKVIISFNVPHRNEAIKALVEKHKNSFKIDKEDVTAHKRVIKPADYKNKLKPATIRKLNERFKGVLKKLHYEI